MAETTNIPSGDLDTAAVEAAVSGAKGPEREPMEEITIKFAKGLCGEPFRSKDGKELVRIQISNAIRSRIETPDLLFHGGIGLKMTAVEEGYAEGEIPVTPKLGNPIGTVHGGAYLALADNVSGVAAASGGWLVTTASCHFNFLAAPKNTSKLVCRARVIKNGKRLIVVETRIYDDQDNLLNTALLEYAKLKPDKEIPYVQQRENE